MRFHKIGAPHLYTIGKQIGRDKGIYLLRGNIESAPIVPVNL